MPPAKRGTNATSCIRSDIDLNSNRKVSLTDEESFVLRRFSNLFYLGPQGGNRPFESVNWMGVPALKCPLDLWIYQEILFERRPKLIIETGTRFGGTTLFLAHLCDLLNHGTVVSIDIDTQNRPAHPRITYLSGSSVDPSTVRQALQHRPNEANAVGSGMIVILDSDHSYDHVLAEMEAFAPHLNAGDYLVVEDTNLNGHPVLPEMGPGPHEAVEAFLARHPEYHRDHTREKFLLTFNPGGYLKRVDNSDLDNPSRSAAGANCHEDPYRSCSSQVDVTASQARQTALDNAQLRETIASLDRSLSEALEQLRAHQIAGENFRATAEALSLAVLREASLHRQLKQVTNAFQESMRQLDAAQLAADGFRNAVMQLNLSHKREAELTQHIHALEQALSMADTLPRQVVEASDCTHLEKNQ